MRILVSHVNYPSQFRRLIPLLIEQGHEIIFLARQTEWHCPHPSGFTLKIYTNSRKSSGPSIHPYLHRFENAILEGQSVFRLALELRNNNWIPDCIISHVGFGNGLFLKDCFPTSKRIGLVEWFYNSFNSDVDFLPPKTISDDHRLCLRAWNSECLLEMSSLDHAVVPTYWQLSQFPSIFKSCFNVIHEGVDTNLLSNLKGSSINAPSCLPPNSDIQVLTYVSRCFEEYRGFPQVAETISILQSRRKNLHVLIVGQDGAAYGHKRSDGLGWSQWAKKNFTFDPNRTHWLGSLQESEYHEVLSVSDVHLYLTVPFVLSWSLLEAMSSRCPIVASNTPPVLEVLQDEFSALLVDFFDVPAQVEAICRLLDDRTLALRLASSASKKANEFSVQRGLDGWSSLISA